MCLNVHTRFVKKSKKAGMLFLVKGNGVPNFRWVLFRTTASLFELLFAVPIHHYPFLTLNKTLTLEGVFQPPARASCFEHRKSFRDAQNTTCRVRLNTKIRSFRRIEYSREKQLRAVSFLTRQFHVLLHKPVYKNHCTN
ncbi:MAG: hypothetical protein TRG1_1977 [Flavobacteriaceae bacterium FS1-H7996/R]|nr:MAG: hypothetical protein TRG1_1977 [Flavobacteriaceae bacterium FS1-H7996/R]